jgi:hypothetical protein
MDQYVNESSPPPVDDAPGAQAAAVRPTEAARAAVRTARREIRAELTGCLSLGIALLGDCGLRRGWRDWAYDFQPFIEQPIAV